jgi:ribosomal protein S18 acetylase RimI-like enzyme
MMNSDYKVVLRKIKAADLGHLVALFKETVHHINAKDYSPAQLSVWAPDNIHPSQDSWQSILGNIAYLAAIDKIIVGFADMTAEGYLDRLYVHKDYQRRGIASMLVNKLESELLKQGLKRITTEASITAKPFFEQRGYRVIKEQNKPRPGGITLTNFLMEKCLDNPRNQESVIIR